MRQGVRLSKTTVLFALLIAFGAPLLSSCLSKPDLGRCEARPLQLRVGDQIPDALLYDLALQQQSLDDVIADKVALIDIWATWCAPCKKSLPHLQALHNRYEGRGFTVVGIMSDRNAHRIGPEFVADKGLRYPMFLDNRMEEVNCAWGAPSSMPTMILVDRDKSIIGIYPGIQGLKTIDTTIEKMLSMDATAD